ncbi:HAD family hydrolase [Faecalibacillus intestinalis]|uniref:HAD family hydrolase n=1 Tax=Faecalibacillus intestinalis TaxID=1982626 RepID=UPI0022E30B67|nr:HAD hydrolase family protein [Faecalibacillus intestinalis]
MIKLIATDMDGTFLDSSKRFSMEFFDIFEELRKRKNKICDCIGEPIFPFVSKIFTDF